MERCHIQRDDTTKWILQTRIWIMIWKTSWRYQTSILCIATSLFACSHFLRACWMALLAWSNLHSTQSSAIKTDSRPIHSTPFQVRPKARKFEKLEMDRVLSTLRPDGHHRLCSSRRNSEHLDLPQLWETQFNDDPGLVPDAVHGRMCPTSSRQYDISNTEREQRILQVEGAQDDRTKAMFTSHHGLFRLTPTDPALNTTYASFNEHWTSYLQKSSGSFGSI